MCLLNNLIIIFIIINCMSVGNHANVINDELPTSGIHSQTTDGLLVGNGNTSAIVKRSKRYLDLLPKSRMFFRVNIKDNIIKLNQFWAHAYGYRANFPIENRPRMKRSDVYLTVDELLSQHGFDGRACVLKTFCDASKKLTPDSGLLFKLFKLMFANTTDSNRLPEGDEKLYPYLGSDNCDELYTHCPLALLDLSPYTDI